jgi:hypothetical protein
MNEDAIDLLIRFSGLSEQTSTAVRAAIAKVLDQGRELDAARAEFKRIGDAIDTAEYGSPCRDRLIEREHHIAGRIDALRSMLGVVNG